ncbi:FAD:protein FMN transferase [Microbacteriaceae bacterium VKM Ac-2855]|nr:FAD:protein FMN transferase [Microbacteriaceae bacterium VKM Ac-2855]
MPPRNTLTTAWDFDAIGTGWRIETDTEVSEATRSRVAARIDEFDRSYSRFRDDSLASRLRDASGRFDFPSDAEPLFAVYDALFALTAGAVTPFVGDALERLGYDAAYTLMPHGAPEPAPSWAAARTGAATTISTAAPVVLDVGAAGKGYLVDLVLDVLADAGMHRAVVDASGDMRAVGVPDYRVAMEHPYDARRAIGVIEPGERALCASASNRRAWGEGLHHVLDGRTGLPVRTVVATWAIADSGLLADALATALFLVEPDTLAERFDFDYLRMFSDGTAQYSATFPGEVFR